MKIWGMSIVAFVCLTGLFIAGKTIQNGQKKLTITSSAFKDGEALTAKYTCDCPAAQNCPDGYSPPVTIANIAREVKALALICDDPDAVGDVVPWVHWLWWNLPVKGDSVTIQEHADMAKLGAREGINSDGKTNYAGPCPPPGTGIHHYKFTVYALDTMLSLEPGATAEALTSAMKDHVVAQATLVGTYQSQASA
jgi:Raf kinase inhibitor-like YbhB/YbcL family protein